MSLSRTEVSAPGAPAPAGPYSPGISFANLLFCSGQTPVDPDSGTLMAGEIGDRARCCLEHLQRICRAAGTDIKAAVRISVYMTDLGAFDGMNTAYAEYFAGSAPPARTTIGVAALPLGADIEMDAIVGQVAIRGADGVFS